MTRTLYAAKPPTRAQIASLAQISATIEIPPEQLSALPTECKNIREGQFSYVQAAHIAEQHLIDGITLHHGEITCSHPQGISCAIKEALAVWSGVDDTAEIPTPDLSSCQLATKKKSKVGSVNDIARMAGPKAATILWNALQAGPRVILRSAFELLRANTVTRIISAVVLLAVDTVGLIKRRISRKQYVINLGLALMLTVGGTVGWLLGQQTAAQVLIENAILGIIAGIAGAGLFGAGLGALWERIVRMFVKDDRTLMLDIYNETFTQLADEYLLNQQEADVLMDAIIIKDAQLKAIFSQCDRETFARCTLEPYFAGIIHLREKIRSGK